MTFGVLPSSLLTEPVSHFFWMANQMERVKAEEDLRQLRLLAHAGGMLEGTEAYIRSLEKHRGEIYHWGSASGETLKVDLDEASEDQLDPEFDRSALHALKARHHL